MQKWYAPCRLLLVAAVTLQLAGCATASRTIGRWTGRDRADEQLAELDGQAEKAAKSKSTDARIPETASKSKKPADKAEGTSRTSSQVADAGSSSKSKAGTSPATTKSSSSSSSAEVAASEIPRAQIKPADKSTGERTEGFRSLPRDPFLDAALAANATPEQEQQSNAALPFPDMTPGVAKTASPAAERTSTAPAAQPAGDIAFAGLSDGLPEWALDDVPAARPQEPVISQIVASKLQPGQLKPGLSTAPPRPSGPVTPPEKQLSSLCPQAQGEVRTLVKELDSSDSETLKRAIHRLGRMQTHAAAAAPALRALTQHSDSFVRVHAALALVRMQQLTPEVTDTLIAGLRSPDPGVRSFAAAVLAEMGPHSTDAVPALSAALHDQDGYVRLHVAEVLIRHADWSYPALQTLLDSLQDSDENIRWLATYSLAELAPQSAEAVTALTATLRDPTPKVQIGAAYALGEIGPIASPATSDLQRCQLSNNPELRSAAEYALQQIQY